MSNPVSARRDSLNFIYSVGPDVCWTPFGPLILPIPYSSTSKFGAATRTSKTVRNNGCQDFQSNSRSYLVKGHEPGSVKGVFVPGHVDAYAHVRKGSSTVFSEGWQVVRDGDPAWINRPDEGPQEPKRSQKSVCIEHM